MKSGMCAEPAPLGSNKERKKAENRRFIMHTSRQQVMEAAGSRRWPQSFAHQVGDVCGILPIESNKGEEVGSLPARKLTTGNWSCT